MAMSNLDWLTAVATGVGQGEQMQEQRQMAAQQRQDVLRQQALENVMAKHELEFKQAKFAQDQKEFTLLQEAAQQKTDRAAGEALRKLSEENIGMVGQLSAAYPGGLPTLGTTQVPATTTYGALTPEQEHIRAMLSRPAQQGQPASSAERLFAPTTMAGPIDIQRTPAHEELTIEQTPWGEVSREGLLKQRGVLEGRKTMAGIQQAEATATSAEAKALHAYDTEANKLALLQHQVTSAGYKTIADQLAIAPAALEELKATIGLAHTTEFLNSYYNLMTKELREGYTKADVNMARNKAVEVFINKYGFEPNVWNMLQVLGIREQELNLKMNPPAKPPSAPNVPTRPSPVLQADKLINMIGRKTGPSKTPRQAAADIRAMPLDPAAGWTEATREQKAKQAETTTAGGTRPFWIRPGSSGI